MAIDPYRTSPYTCSASANTTPGCVNRTMSWDPASAMLWLFQSNAIGTEAQRTETVMMNLMDIDERYRKHQARIARAERDGWLLEAAKSSRDSRSRIEAKAGHPLRRAIGHAVVHCGEWLQGTPDVESTSPAPING
jgi:hypothetical protein